MSLRQEIWAYYSELPPDEQIKAFVMSYREMESTHPDLVTQDKRESAEQIKAIWAWAQLSEPAVQAKVEAPADPLQHVKALRDEAESLAITAVNNLDKAQEFFRQAIQNDAARKNAAMWNNLLGDSVVRRI